MPEANLLELPLPEPYSAQDTEYRYRPADRAQVFEEVFRSRFNNLLRYAAGILQDVATAEEMVQQVFCRLWEKNHLLNNVQSIDAYLYRSVHNQCLNYLKHTKTRDKHHSRIRSSGKEGAEDQDRLALKELQGKIAKVVNELPEQCRTIFQMCRFEHLKYREVAERLGISEKTVENQMGKALKTLKDRLKDYLPVIIFIITASSHIL